MNKYELVDCEHPGFKRIMALRDITSINVHEGDIGGLVSGYHNLSQEGDSWIEYGARAEKESLVSGNALVKGYAALTDKAWAMGRAVVSGYARLRDRSRVMEDGIVTDSARLTDCAAVFGKAIVSGFARMKDWSYVFGEAWISGNTLLSGNASVSEDSKVFGFTHISGTSRIRHGAIVYEPSDFITFECPNMEGRAFEQSITWTKSNNLWSSGNFNGTGKALIDRAENMSDALHKFCIEIVKYVDDVVKLH